MLNYDKPSRIFPCILLTRNHMIFLVQFGISKRLLIFSKTTNCTRPTGLCNLLKFVFKKIIYSCLFIPNCTWNHVITSNNRTICTRDRDIGIASLREHRYQWSLNKQWPVSTSLWDCRSCGFSWLSDTETFDMIRQPPLYGMTVILAS